PSIMLIVGAGHVSMPLTSLARIVGFKTIVIDGRPRFATRERFPDVDELKIGIPSELVREVPLVPTTALVLVAHDYKYDLPVLKHALQTPVGYIGLLGSSRRGKAILDLLREDGVAEDLLTRVRVPIGLDLGAQAAPEIALAVLAQELEPGDIHEEPAGARLSQAAAGEGVEVKGYSGGQWTLAAARRGLLRVREQALAEVNAQEGMAVYTLYDLQPVEAGEAVARAK